MPPESEWQRRKAPFCLFRVKSIVFVFIFIGNPSILLWKSNRYGTTYWLGSKHLDPSVGQINLVQVDGEAGGSGGELGVEIVRPGWPLSNRNKRFCFQ